MNPIREEALFALALEKPGGDTINLPGRLGYYNFARIHQTLRVTPAMEAKASDHVWSLEENR